MTFKKLFVFALISCVFASCKSTETTEPEGEKQDPLAGSYGISYQIDGVDVISAEYAAYRLTDVDPDVLNIIGSASGSTHPSMQIRTEKTVIGFVPGLNVGCNSNSFSAHFVSFTNASGELSTTSENADGIDVFFSKLSYVKDGDLEGTFSGTVQNSAGKTSSITNGKFKLKFAD